MGLLDEAIREHLELKRRRGADPNEVEQLEHEALGPVRRGTQVVDEPLPDEEPFDHDEPLDEQPPFERQGSATVLYDDEADEGVANSAQLASEASFTEAPHEPFPEDRPERGWSHDSGEQWDAEEELEEHEPAAPAAEGPVEPAPEPPAARPPDERARRPAPAEPPRQGPPEQPGQETVEYDVEAEQRRKGEEDVLEETPEFLQDTPDHDRLWFEQRPPKDFDFDK